MIKEDCTQYCKNCFKLQKALDEIEMIVGAMVKRPIMVFPEYSLLTNAKVIIESGNIGYTMILDVISKTKEAEKCK
jgi:hypothetical protein